MTHFINTYYAYTQLAPTDIYPIQYGEEQCKSSHSFGPCMRSNYLIHYVYSGEGIFKTENAEYRLHKNQMFLIMPNQLTYYRADENNPWLYRWIEFGGSMVPKILKSSGLCEQLPIRDDEQMITGNALSDIVLSKDMHFTDLMQKFWGFISAMSVHDNMSQNTSIHKYIDKAEIFIKTNVHKKISVSDVAAYVGIDRSYLSRLFQTHKNTTPQQYIISLKMNVAAQYLQNTDISISEAAYSVGYTDTHVFNKAFKTRFGISPSAWRCKQNWEQFII